MSKFICNLCSKEFTTKYGLQKHSNKKIPCTLDKKTKYQCNKCNAYLSSKRNLDEHIFNHRLDSIKIENREAISENIKLIDDNKLDTQLEDNLIQDNLIQDNLELNSSNSIQITVEEYNYFRTEINSLKDELIKVNIKLLEANDEIKKLKNENKRLNSTIINNITNNNSTNIDNSTTNNVQITNNININIISFSEIDMIPPSYIDNRYMDSKAALYDFSKNFNRVNLDYSMERNGLNYNQKCKQEKLKKIVAKNRKQKLPLLCLGVCEVLEDFFSVPEHKSIRYITKYLFELLNGNKWEPITVYCAYRALFQLFIGGAKESYKAASLKLSNKNKSIDFLIDDYQKNPEEYYHYGKGEFINMIKKIHAG